MSSLLPGRWDPTIHRRLCEMITVGREVASQGIAPVATFDWDNTAIRGDIGEAILEFLDARDGTDRMRSYEEICEREGKTVGYPWAAFQIAGMTEEEVRRLTTDVMGAGIASGRISPRPEMHDLMRVLEANGWDVWIVSASAEPLVQVFASTYGIPDERVIGVRVATDSRGVFQETLAGPNTFRGGKVEAIDQLIGRRPFFAAGDTETDIEMLRCARFRLLMDRGDRLTRSEAEAGGWWIQPAVW